MKKFFRSLVVALGLLAPLPALAAGVTPYGDISVDNTGKVTVKSFNGGTVFGAAAGFSTTTTAGKLGVASGAFTIGDCVKAADIFGSYQDAGLCGITAVSPTAPIAASISGGNTLVLSINSGYFLRVANNLSDVANAATALANLGGASSTATFTLGSTSIALGSTHTSVTGLTVDGLTIVASSSSLSIATGKTFASTNTLTFAGTDGSTLNIGTGGTLGTAALQNTGTSGATIPFLNGANTWSGNNTFTSAHLLIGNASSGLTTLTGTSSASNFTATLPANAGTIAELNLAQQWGAVQTFPLGDLVLKSVLGSGTLALNLGGNSGANVITFPVGTTDFSATGGASQVVQQLSVGAALTVGQMAFSDLTGSAANSQLPAAPLTVGSSTGNTYTAPIGYFVCSSTCTVTPPVPAAGYQFCILNADNVATVITLGAIGSSARYENTARTAFGTAGTGTLTSGGAIGDSLCLVGQDSTHYVVPNYTGTWVAS